MKKIDLGQTIGIVGNIAVVISILLLVFELNQNREMMRAQTRNELSQGVVEMLLEIGSSDESAAIYMRGNRSEELSEVERQRYTLLTVAQLRYHENVFYQYRNGMYDEAEYDAQRTTWRNSVFSDQGLAEVFCGSRQGFSTEFVAEIESLLTTHECD